MRFKVLLITPLIFLISFFVLSINSFASSPNDIEMEIIKMPNPPTLRTFRCFDVNDKHEFLVAYTDTMNEDAIVVYDENGFFLYGFKFEYNGSILAEWEGENILVYLQRSSITLCIDNDGVILNKSDKWEDESEMDKYLRQNVRSGVKVIGDTVYEDNHGESLITILPKYKITAADSLGNSTVIYSATSSLIFTLLRWGLVVLVVLGGGSYVVFTVLKNKRKRDEKQ